MNMQRISLGSLFLGTGGIAVALSWSESLGYKVCKSERAIFDKCMKESPIDDLLIEAFRFINHIFDPFFKRNLCSIEYKSLSDCLSISKTTPAGVYLLGLGSFLLLAYGSYNLYRHFNQLQEEPLLMEDN